MRGLLGFLLVVLAGCGSDSAPGDLDAALDSNAVCATSADCDDGTFCDGTETCDPADPTAGSNGCVAGEAPCTVTETCDESTDACMPRCKVDDADGDGRVAAACDGDDCDDDDPLAFPGNAEICDVDGRDEDCDPATFGFRDLDGDLAPDEACCNGANCGTDCDDSRPDVHSDEAESCDERDNDCDGETDEGVEGTYYPDMDGDMFGDPMGMPVTGCRAPSGYAEVATDCDDDDAALNPGLAEVCDDEDNDCDTRVDEMAMPTTWYRDDDGDGFGATGSGTVISCTPVAGHSLYDTDCDDDAPSVHPAASDDTCNGLDDDCNGWFDGPMEDADGDRHARASCGGDDCDDGDENAYPGAPEICDRRDSDCSSGGGAAAAEDVDNDGYAPIGVSVCMGGPRAPADCNDMRAMTYPGAPDYCNGEDDDCDGAPDDGASSTCALANATSTCTAGVCTIVMCNTTYETCDGLHTTGCEVNLATSLAHCGACGNACSTVHATPECVTGMCQLTCATGWGDCTGGVMDGCETSTTTVANCGSCGVTCAFDHAVDACISSLCELGMCDPTWGNCNGLPGDGCEASLRTTTDCVICGTACSLPHATESCASGSCTITSCDVGWGDCMSGGGASAGCESDLTSTRDHCSGCGMACIARGAGACAGSVCHPRIEWSRAIGTNGSQQAVAVAVDGSGNVYVAGHYERDGVNFGGGATTNEGLRDAFLASYGPAGTFRWVRTIGSVGDDLANDVVVAGGRVVVVGWFAGSADFGDGAPTGATSVDGFVAAYDAATGAHDWHTAFGDAGDETVLGVTVSPSGEIHTVGQSFPGSVTIGALTLTGEVVLLRLSASTGAVLDGDAYNYGQGRKIAVDAAGNRYIAGLFVSSITFPPRPTLLPVEDGYELFVAKVSPTGAGLWSVAYGNLGGDEMADIVLDSAGNVAFLASPWTAIDFGGGLVPSPATPNQSLAIVSLDAATGAHRWSRGFGDDNIDRAQSLFATSSGSLVATSQSSNAIDLGGGNHAGAPGPGEVASYDADTGAFEWSYRLSPSIGNAWAIGGAETSSGRVLIVGTVNAATNLGAGMMTYGGGADDALIVSLTP